MSYARRQETGRLLCQKLAEAVARITPEGIGGWDRAWEIVDGSSAEFMLALSSWETAPTDELRLRVSDCYDGVLAAWRQAGVEYTQRATATIPARRRSEGGRGGE